MAPIHAFWRAHTGLLAPLLGAVVAGAVVAGVALATGSTSTTTERGISFATTPAPPATEELENAFVRVVRSVSPSVVQIEGQKGLGSGIVLDSAGDIVTNNHVVSGEGSLTVTASNGKRYPAALVGTFASDDLAVIQVPGARLKPAVFADSSKLAIGDLVLAIGNPLGLRSSVTQGIVSSFRQGVSEGGSVTLPSVIQTSAAINPGNSGGALVDISGHVVGIPTLAAIDPELGGSAPGIGFAIPSNLVSDIAGQIVAHGKVVNSHRAFLGITAGDTNGHGVIVGTVTAGSAAARAGMKKGQIIVSVDRARTPTLAALSTVLARLKPGETVPVVVKRQNGTRTTLHVKLGTYPGG